MNLKLVDPDKMKSLDDYVVMLCTGIMTLNTLKEFHVKALNMGILKEDHELRVNTILWDLKRLVKLYADQAESLLEFLPDGFSVEDVIKKISANEIKATKKLSRSKVSDG